MIGHRRVGLEEGGGAWVEEALRLRLEVERGGRRRASEGVRHGGWLELSWGERVEGLVPVLAAAGLRREGLFPSRQQPSWGSMLEGLVPVLAAAGLRRLGGTLFSDFAMLFDMILHKLNINKKTDAQLKTTQKTTPTRDRGTSPCQM